MSIAIHYYALNENWSGEFLVKEEKVRDYPSTWIILDNQKIKSNIISYKGNKVLAYNIDKDGGLSGFAGYSTTGIKIDVVEYRVVSEPGDLISAKIHPSRLLQDIVQCWIIYSTVNGNLDFHSSFKK